MSKSKKNFKEAFFNILVSVFVQRDEDKKSKVNKFMRFVTWVDIILVAMLMMCVIVILFLPFNNNTVSLFIYTRDLIDVFLVPSLLVNIFLLFTM